MKNLKRYYNNLLLDNFFVRMMVDLGENRSANLLYKRWTCNGQTTSQIHLTTTCVFDRRSYCYMDFK